MQYIRVSGSFGRLNARFVRKKSDSLVSFFLFGPRFKLSDSSGNSLEKLLCCGAIQGNASWGCGDNQSEYNLFGNLELAVKNALAESFLRCEQITPWLATADSSQRHAQLTQLKQDELSKKQEPPCSAHTARAPLAHFPCWPPCSHARCTPLVHVLQHGGRHKPSCV